ncbi:MAG: zinc ribbon domain-containing protein [Verrucomicrobia bacterium]|nr:MAG: zinc ribbon domain-containing protein [Verrucomicrobiota bacterium]
MQPGAPGRPAVRFGIDPTRPGPQARGEDPVTPDICPNCGADIPPGARVCPECGSDEQTGWSEEAYASGLDLPDEEFDYDEFLAREFGGGTPKEKRARRWRWVLVLVMLGLLLYYLWP